MWRCTSIDIGPTHRKVRDEWGTELCGVEKGKY